MSKLHTDIWKDKTQSLQHPQQPNFALTTCNSWRRTENCYYVWDQSDCERKGFQTVTQVLQQSYFSSNCLSFIEDEKNSQRWQLHAYIECRNTIHILLWRSSKTNPMMKLDINFRIKSVYFHRHHKSTHSIVYMYIWCISKYQYWISMNWIPVYIPSFGGSYID